ncbi:MAG: hypothetical protein RJA09_1761 [Pseudomonadota bacterium]
MFAIHGVSGQLFQGPLEDLRKVAAVTPPNRVKALTALGLLPEPDPAGHGPTPHLQATSTAGQALQTYHRVQQPPPQRRPLSVVADVMNTDPMVLADTQTVLAAWTQLAERGVGQAPVVTAQGRLVGMLTRADLLDPQRLPQPDGSVLVWRALLVQPVTALMVTPVPSVFPDTDLRRLAQALLDTGLPGLPVVDHAGGVVGFVSRADILVAVVHDPPLDLWAG